MRKLLWSVVGVLCISATHADGLTLQPYVATYEVTYRGLDAGTLRMQLTYDAHTNRYTFETQAKPSLLTRLVIGRDALERTIVEPIDGSIRPLEWHLEDGKHGNRGDGQLTFDWSAQRVTGEYEGKPVELPTQPGMQDRLSIQLAVNAALAQGREPGSIVMINGNRAREYNYERGPNTQLETKLGTLDTVLYRSTRPGSDRVSKVWHAPSMEHVPVRAEQIRKGKIETVMELVAFQRTPASSTSEAD